MPLKYPEKTINQTSTISELLANLITIGSWVLSIISAATLASQKQPISIPGINVPLDTEYQFALLISALLAYIHFLIHHWKKKRSTMRRYVPCAIFILYEIPLKRPLWFAPFVLFWAVGYKVTQPNVMLRNAFDAIVTALSIAVVSAFFYNLYKEGEYYDDESKSNLLEYNDKLKHKWVQRIQRKLDEQGTVSTKDFLDEVGLSPHEFKEVNSAFRIYFDQFEFNQNLTLRTGSREKYGEYLIDCDTLSRRGNSLDSKS